MSGPQRFRILGSLIGLVVFWGLAVLVALDDIDFFSLQDFRDTAGLHHEHIFAVLGFLGLVSGALAVFFWSYKQR